MAVNSWLRSKARANSDTVTHETSEANLCNVREGCIRNPWLRSVESVTNIAEEVLSMENDDIHEKFEEEDIVMEYEKSDDKMSGVEWEAYTNGTASRIMKKYGFNGKSLGKFGDGIQEPVKVVKKTRFDQVESTILSAHDIEKYVQIPEVPSDVYPWPDNTVLIAGDSMLNGINEKRLSQELNVKVRPHSGATIRDMYEHLTALLRKIPKYLILHVGANDTTNEKKTVSMIYEEIVRLKLFAEAKVPGIIVTISCPIVRRDNEKANIKVLHLRHKFRTSGLSVIANDRVTYDYLGDKGLHLTQKRGLGRFSSSLIAHLKRL